MKKIQFSLLFILVACLFSACDKHDMLDDNLIVGQIAPQVYWELKSTTVEAGSNVPFKVYYYTTGEAKLDHLEVWYNVTEVIDKAISCPWVTTFTYSSTTSKSEEKRIDEKVSAYSHQDSYWDATQRAYVFDATFPTSVTLSTLSWVKPENFGDADMEKLISYFDESFLQDFRSGLYSRMKEADFQKMLEGLDLVTNFRDKYLERVYNDFTGQDEYLFPRDGSGNRSVPAEVKAMFDAIPFPDLIINTTTSIYDLEYIRSYNIKAYIKAVDAKGNTGQSITTEINLN